MYLGQCGDRPTFTIGIGTGLPLVLEVLLQHTPLAPRHGSSPAWPCSVNQQKRIRPEDR